MTSHLGTCARRLLARVALACGILSGLTSLLPAQTRDTTRVTYRTRDVVFVAAGRAQGVAVGDTLELRGADGSVIGRAVVVSIAQRSASARLLEPDTEVPVGALVGYERRAVEVTEGAAAAPDTALAAPTDTATPPPRYARTPAARRARGSVSVDQFASSSGPVTTYQTAMGLAFQAPLGPSVELRTRVTGRWRDGASSLSSLDGLSVIPYQVELRVAPQGSAWRGSLGRLMAIDAYALGYLDGASIEVRPSGGARFGAAAGFVPEAAGLDFSTKATRAGAWFGAGSATVNGTLSGAMDWSEGEHRRTLVGLQGGWSPTRAVSVSLYADADVAPAWDTTRTGATLTSLFASLRLPLPLGFQAGLSLQSSEPVRQWSQAADTVPLPGRLNGGSVSVARDIAGTRVELSGSALERDTDPTPTVRGALSLSRSGLFVVASTEHGPIGDYTYATARLALTRPGAPVALALGGVYGRNTLATGGITITRYSVRPELVWANNGLLFTLGGDIGRYGDGPTRYLHAGVAYHFR